MTNIGIGTRPHYRTRTMGVAALLLGAICVVQVHAQTCNPNLPPTRPNTRYEVVAGTNPPGSEVRDTVTGLIWQRCLLGMTYANNGCTGQDVGLAWQAAMQAAVDATPTTAPNATPWRIPTRDELASLVERTCILPSINATWFPNMPSHYMWTSSTFPNNPSYARSISFLDGIDLGPSDSTNSKILQTNLFRIRLVRSGP